MLVIAFLPRNKSLNFMTVVTMETVTDFIFFSSKSLRMVTAAMKLKDACSLEENL